MVVRYETFHRRVYKELGRTGDSSSRNKSVDVVQHEEPCLHPGHTQSEDGGPQHTGQIANLTCLGESQDPGGAQGAEGQPERRRTLRTQQTHGFYPCAALP